ncbi:MAG: hypothetical protein A4E48_02775 [Methanosaeta sp. PtaU1.Bin060]|jgi:hypothetical protein|nr:MAG: hypothetical protein A4E48_02775 [Methanosaeta sp. PtaU1.Bin060]
MPLPGLTYDIWNEIIEEVIDCHAPLLDAMHRAAECIRLSKELVEELKIAGAMEFEMDSWSFTLALDLYADEIGGFCISLVSSEGLEAFWLIEAEAAADRGFASEDIEGFEIEHGLKLDEEIFDAIRERFGITAEAKDDEVIFELLLFDSQDIDNSIENEGAWDEEV